MRPLKYLSLVGLALFAYILSTVDVPRTFALVARCDPSYLLLGLSLVLLEVLVRSVNWWLLARIYSRGYGYVDALQTYMIGIAFGAVTPGKAGDFVKVADLSGRTGLPLARSFSIGLLDRLINFVVLFISAAAALAAVGFVFSGGSGLAAFVVPVSAAVAVVLFALNEKLSLLVLRPLQGFIVPERFRGDARGMFRTFHGTVGQFKGSGYFLAVLALTLLGWFVIYVRPYFFARALGMDVPLWMFILFTPIISAVEVLPVSVMGLGTRDAAIILLLSYMGLDRERMVALSILMLALSSAPQALAGYAIALKKGAAALRFTST